MSIEGTTSMSKTIYKSGTVIFIPTKKYITISYENGNAGEQLWESMIDGLLNGNYFSLNEVLSYNPTTIKI